MRLLHLFFFVHWMCMHIKWNCVAQFIVIWCTKSNPVECLSLRVDFRNNPHKENTWYPQASEKNAKSIQTTAAKRNNDWEKPRTISLLLSIERCHFLWLVFECIYIYITRWWRWWKMKRQNSVRSTLLFSSTSLVFLLHTIWFSKPACAFNAQLLICTEILPILHRHDMFHYILQPGAKAWKSFEILYMHSNVICAWYRHTN